MNDTNNNQQTNNHPSVMQRPSFTLIEILVVVAIIGILAGIGVIAIPNMQAKSRNALRMANVEKIQIAFEKYYQKNGRYPYPTPDPTTHWIDVGYKALEDILVPDYIDALPKDPLNVSSGFNCGGPPYYCPWSTPAPAYFFHMHIIVTGAFDAATGLGDNFQHYIIMVGLERPGSGELLKQGQVIIGDVRRNPVNTTDWQHTISWDFSTPHLGLESDIAFPPGDYLRPTTEQPLDDTTVLYCGDFSSNYTYNPNNNPWDPYHKRAGNWANLCIGHISGKPLDPCVGEQSNPDYCNPKKMGVLDCNVQFIDDPSLEACH